jgi:hypothetical protein
MFKTSGFDPKDTYSVEKTPWAVTCYRHKLVYLTADEYMFQLGRPDSLWTCPVCGHPAAWNDDNYTEYQASIGG